MSEEKTLNSQQLEAVTFGTGPLLIIAGAGTGKTTVITSRIQRLVTDKLAKTSEILALTFTEKAAAEMETRLDVALPYGYTQMWVTTFHSFCDRILKDDALHIGLTTDYRLMTETDSVAFFQKHFFDFTIDYFRPLGNPYKFIDGLLTHFSRLKDEDVSPDHYLDWVATTCQQEDKAMYQELATLYSQYETLKGQLGVLDFGDLISYTLKLFRTRPQVLARYQQQFKYILVDEFQDTNYAQNLLIQLLAGSAQNLTVVADDDQAIYRWRGAAVSNVIQFRHTYPKAKLIVLSHNYRSTQEILDRSYALIQNNNPDRLEIKEGINKKLVANTKHIGDPIDFIHTQNLESEADAVAETIAGLLAKGSHPQDIAILVRANAHSEPFLKALDSKGIPCQFLGPSQLFQRPEVKDLIAYLHVLNNLEDDVSFYRVASMDLFHLPAKQLSLMAVTAKKLNLHLFTAAEKDSTGAFKPIVDLINSHLTLVPKLSVGQILYTFLQDSGLIATILSYSSSEEEVIAQNYIKLFNRLKSFETNRQDASLSAAIAWLDLAAQIGESPLAAQTDLTQSDCVNILTIHSAKGLEFPVVFLVNLVVGRFPSLSRKDAIPIPDALVKEILPEGDFHLEEERRLFYVGMTRAKTKLFFTASDFSGEAKRQKKLSPFIAEALGTQPTQAAPQSSPAFSTFSTSPTPTPNHKSSAIKVTYLSSSQIETFIDCPLHYKAKYILNIPTPPSAASSFGNCIHATLRQFYTSYIRKTPEEILEILHRNWTHEGYENKQHEQAYLTRGEHFLTSFVKTCFDPDHLPDKLEEPFTVPLSGDLKIGGKIDRVDVLRSGSIEIIDYKTSNKILTQKQADDDLQLSFYAIAATLLPDAPFHLRPDQITLSLFYLDSQTKVSTVRTAKQLEAAKHQITAYADTISNSAFQCSGSIICKKCDYQMLCGLAKVYTD